MNTTPQNNINVPLASTGLAAVALFELTHSLGDLSPSDAQEAIAYETGGLFTHVVNSNGSVVFTAEPGTTVGQTDTITLDDDGEEVEYTLTAVADTVTGIELESVSYSHAPVAAASSAAAGSQSSVSDSAGTATETETETGTGTAAGSVE